MRIVKISNHDSFILDNSMFVVEGNNSQGYVYNKDVFDLLSIDIVWDVPTEQDLNAFSEHLRLLWMPVHEKNALLHPSLPYVEDENQLEIVYFWEPEEYDVQFCNGFLPSQYYGDEVNYCDFFLTELQDYQEEIYLDSVEDYCAYYEC